MPIEERRNHALEIVGAQLKALESIFERAGQDHDFAAARERVARWKERTASLLGEQVHPREAERFLEKQQGSFVRDPFRNLAGLVNMYRGFLLALVESLGEHADTVLAPEGPAVPKAPPERGSATGHPIQGSVPDSRS
jgi:hypothetical protein